jgi:hypothetical protein
VGLHVKCPMVRGPPCKVSDDAWSPCKASDGAWVSM